MSSDPRQLYMISTLLGPQDPPTIRIGVDTRVRDESIVKPVIIVPQDTSIIPFLAGVWHKQAVNGVDLYLLSSNYVQGNAVADGDRVVTMPFDIPGGEWNIVKRNVCGVNGYTIETFNAGEPRAWYVTDPSTYTPVRLEKLDLDGGDFINFLFTFDPYAGP